MIIIQNYLVVAWQKFHAGLNFWNSIQASPAEILRNEPLKFYNFKSMLAEIKFESRRFVIKAKGTFTLHEFLVAGSKKIGPTFKSCWIATDFLGLA